MAADPDLDALIPAGGGGDPLQGAIAAVQARQVILISFLQTSSQTLEKDLKMDLWLVNLADITVTR